MTILAERLYQFSESIGLNRPILLDPLMSSVNFHFGIWTHASSLQLSFGIPFKYRLWPICSTWLGNWYCCWSIIFTIILVMVFYSSELLVLAFQTSVHWATMPWLRTSTNTTWATATSSSRSWSRKSCPTPTRSTRLLLHRLGITVEYYRIIQILAYGYCCLPMVISTITAFNTSKLVLLSSIVKQINWLTVVYMVQCIEVSLAYRRWELFGTLVDNYEGKWLMT